MSMFRLGQCRCYALRNRQRVIVRARDAEDELTNGIVLQGERMQVLLEIAFLTMQGYEQRDRG